MKMLDQRINPILYSFCALADPHVTVTTAVSLLLLCLFLRVVWESGASARRTSRAQFSSSPLGSAAVLTRPRNMAWCPDAQCRTSHDESDASGLASPTVPQAPVSMGC